MDPPVIIRTAMSSASATPGASSTREWWRGLPPHVRRRLRRLFAAAVVLVLLAGAVLARFLSVENTERDMDLALIEAQARGDVNGVLAQLHGCRQSPSCVATVDANARNPRLLRKGAVKILDLESKTAYAFTGATGNTRLAWTVIGTLPVVQCIEVRRGGNPLTGIKVSLLSVSAPIPNEGGC
jgi:hypothetical protein